MKQKMSIAGILLLAALGMQANNYTVKLSLIHISEPTRRTIPSRMPSSA